MFCVQNGIYETDYAAYQQTAHADNHTALSLSSHLQNNMNWLRYKETTRSLVMEVDVTTWG